MEMRVMGGGCTDRDFRTLMDSHEQLRRENTRLRHQIADQIAQLQPTTNTSATSSKIVGEQLPPERDLEAEEFWRDARTFYKLADENKRQRIWNDRLTAELRATRDFLVSDNYKTVAAQPFHTDIVHRVESIDRTLGERP